MSRKKDATQQEIAKIESPSELRQYMRGKYAADAYHVLGRMAAYDSELSPQTKLKAIDMFLKYTVGQAPQEMDNGEQTTVQPYVTLIRNIIGDDAADKIQQSFNQTEIPSKGYEPGDEKL